VSAIQNRAMVQCLSRRAGEAIILGMVGESVAHESGAAALRVTFRWFPTVLPGAVKIHPARCGRLYRRITRIDEPLATTAFKAKMKPEEARQIYAQRSRIAEFAHAWIKERCGLRQFRCRGRVKATMEATWACLSYNLIRWFGLRRSLTTETATTT